MGQDIFDLVIVASLVIFMLRGVSNGFIGEAAGIFSLVGGFWAARAWNALLAPQLDFISDLSLRSMAACALIFIVAMLVIGLLARILRKLVALSFAGWVDRLGGAFLGLAKGVFIWTLVLIIMEKLFADAAFMRDSRAMPYFHAVIDQIKPWLPPELASHI